MYHGDMHPGNLFVDDDGNLGFLDMGLVFEISPKDAALTRELFLGEWLKDTEKLARILRPWFSGTDDQYSEFKHKLDNVVFNLSDKCVSSYFMDIVFLCLDVDLEPPYFLFCMAKAFVCLFGADSIYTNNLTCREMLDDLVLEYVATRVCTSGLDMLECISSTLYSAVSMDKSNMYKNAAKCAEYLHSLLTYTKFVLGRKK